MGSSLSSASSDTNLDGSIRTLTPADVRHLAVNRRNGLDQDDVLALVVQHPGLSVWHPESGEFILVTPWRHRLELPTIHTISAIRHESELIQAATHAAYQAGSAALIYVDANETRRPAFYVSHSFQRIEDIITFELTRPRIEPVREQVRQSFQRVPIRDHAWLEAILEVDHGAFPWLWWNSRAEFETYLQYPGVEVWAGTVGDQVVSYVGLTHYYGWGHLDRIATLPDFQGKGFGKESLWFAIERMTSQGSQRIALSTQGNNARSRRLYHDVGFRETPQHDYSVYGVIFDSQRVPT